MRPWATAEAIPTVPGPSMTPLTDYLRVTQLRNHEGSLWLHELLLFVQCPYQIGNSRATVGRFSKQQIEAVSSIECNELEHPHRYGPHYIFPEAARREVEQLTILAPPSMAIIDHQWWGDNSTTTPFYGCWGLITSYGILIDPELPSPNAIIYRASVPIRFLIPISTANRPHYHLPSISLSLPHRLRA